MIRFIYDIICALLLQEHMEVENITGNTTASARKSSEDNGNTSSNRSTGCVTASLRKTSIDSLNSNLSVDSHLLNGMTTIFMYYGFIVFYCSSFNYFIIVFSTNTQSSH